MDISNAGPEAAVASVRWLHPGLLLMTITGDIDMVTAPELGRHIENATRFGPAHLVLDLSGVTFLRDVRDSDPDHRTRGLRRRTPPAPPGHPP